MVFYIFNPLKVTHYNLAEEKLTITCDDCGEKETFAGGTYGKAINSAAQMGWKITRKFGMAEHYCPKCID